MKQLIFKIAFTVLSVILFYGCSTEPYDWSQGKPTEIEMIEISFPSITNESIQVGSYIKTTGKELEKIEFILQKYNGTEWVEIEKKQGIKSDKEEDYYVCDFNNLTGFTNYIVLVNVYSSFSTKPIYSNEFNIKTALDEYLLSTGDALDITDKTVTLVTEFSSEKIKPGREEIGIVYSENENEVKNNKSTFIPYTNNSDNLYLTSLSGLTPATTYYYCSCMIIDGQRIFSDNIRSFTLNEIEITQGEVIDLGLDVKWASCNLESSTPEREGRYYGWGNPLDNSNSKKAFKVISGTGYDAAFYSLGNGYRIPTEDEWNKLLQECTWEWIIYKGINGYKVTGKNGNSIFLPAIGYDGSTNGYYYVGTQHSYAYSYTAQRITLSETKHIFENNMSQAMFSIRPVKDERVYCETSREVQNITTNSAHVTGLIKSSVDITERGIWYGEKEYPHPEEGMMQKMEGEEETIAVTLSGLSSQTVYYYATYAKVGEFTYFSNVAKFRTEQEK